MYYGPDPRRPAVSPEEPTLTDPEPANGPEPAAEAIPPLREGDRLSRDEFERRYEAMPDLKKAGLIEGVVYIDSPVQHRSHSQPHGRISGLITLCGASSPCLDVGDNATVRLDEPNEFQPDVFLRLEPECGGKSYVNDAVDYVEGAPELVIEVAASSRQLDLGKKLRVYGRNGVLEYGVWLTRER
jgi:Uma2 family endonuclease